MNKKRLAIPRLSLGISKISMSTVDAHILK